MKKPLRAQALEYLQYLKEQGLTHVPSSGKTFAKKSPPPPAPKSAVFFYVPPPPVARVPSKPPKGGKDTLESIAAEIAACQACALAPTRLHVVPGQGALKPDVMFVGEGPGADEDEQGLAFVGRAGQLLTKMINAMGYARE